MTPFILLEISAASVCLIQTGYSNGFLQDYACFPFYWQDPMMYGGKIATGKVEFSLFTTYLFYFYYHCYIIILTIFMGPMMNGHRVRTEDERL